MSVSSVTRAGLVAESRRTEAASNTLDSQSTAAAAQARQEQAAASKDARMTRAPEATAESRMSLRYVAYTPSPDTAEEPGGDRGTANADAAKEASEQTRATAAQRNAPTVQEMSDRVRKLYDLGP